MFYYYVSCIYIFTHWNVFTVLWTEILSPIHIILYVYLYTLKNINCIFKCNIVPYSYYPILLLLQIILYIYLHTLKCIYSIMNCNIIPYHYYYKLSCIYIYTLWKILDVLSNVILSHFHLSLMFCCSISCIYSYRLWNAYENTHHKHPLFVPWTIHNTHG